MLVIIDIMLECNNKKSRPDRLLLSEDVIGNQKVVGQEVRHNDVSDHSPIWIKSNKKDQGPKPFRLNTW